MYDSAVAEDSDSTLAWFSVNVAGMRSTTGEFLNRDPVYQARLYFYLLYNGSGSVQIWYNYF